MSGLSVSFCVCVCAFYGTAQYFFNYINIQTCNVETRPLYEPWRERKAKKEKLNYNTTIQGDSSVYLIMIKALFVALLAVGTHGATSLLAEKELTLSEQLAQLQKEHAAMKTEMMEYRELVRKTGGERNQVEEKPTSFAEVDESSDDPTIQCQTVCKFVKPAMSGN